MTPTLLMTRPLEQSKGFADKIVDAWEGPLFVVYAPLIEIVPVKTKVASPSAVIFTSVNGVTASAPLNLPKGVTAWCVGTKTAQAAKHAGFDPITGPGTAEGLIADILAAAPLGKLAHICGTHTRGDIAGQLQQAGLHCDVVTAYDQRTLALTPQAKDALAGKSPVIVPLFSPRTGVIFAQQGPYQAKVYAAVISAAVQETLEPSMVTGIECAVRPDAKAMHDATLAALKTAVAST